MPDSGDTYRPLRCFLCAPPRLLMLRSSVAASVVWPLLPEHLDRNINIRKKFALAPFIRDRPSRRALITVALSHSRCQETFDWRGRRMALLFLANGYRLAS
ncbi:Uncharacterized protein HZ326_13713 [Fusarium oxysporum f. sp. albedinis]|nr:Uncharacterized protein HZ326_13713 [Fusarium oxysporum f. sp. albedinis]